MWASQEGHVEVVDRLIEHGARVDLQNEVKLCDCKTAKGSVVLFYMCSSIWLEPTHAPATF